MLRVIETVPIIDTYCSGMSKIEKLPCGNLRLWCYTAQASDCGAGPIENVLVAKLVVPLAAMVPAILMAMATLGVDLDPADLAALSDAVPHDVVHH
jgi:hypothetical protein